MQAHSRLAMLLSELKHSSGAVDALERLQALTKGSPKEAADVARRLREARSAAKLGAVNHYKLLGLGRFISPEDVRACHIQIMPRRSAGYVHTTSVLRQEAGCNTAAKADHPSVCTEPDVPWSKLLDILEHKVRADC